MFSTGNQNQTRRWIDILCQRYGYGMIWIVLLFNVEYVLYCYTIILWNSTLSTILKHSKSRNKSLHAKMNPIFHNLSTKRWMKSSFISAAGCQRPWALLGRCWLGRWKRWRWGAGKRSCRSCWMKPYSWGRDFFESRDMSCHYKRLWDHMNPHPLETLHHVLKCFKTRETKSRIRSYWEDFLQNRCIPWIYTPPRIPVAK